MFIASSIDWRPNMNIASPPINSITLAYLIATFVPKVPIRNQIITANRLKPPSIIGSTPATAPCDDRTKFSICMETIEWEFSPLEKIADNYPICVING